ncbi:MAG TPA: YggS family pyridoxal phosphate-dependent enzyme [Firmicutes bacterium]|uniref:Pyridoxal phosphate homeostasis protein n=1 Tax=Candidatus Fermentithermobacillus carboniphilus TaxID=3085328 RepID=A0AAT9LBQ7_9FIRM|nr:MAG: YggS family pyridoxal phosphate-dependent enzyme [Candidatus Fermentithermobacillus carboniphilus]HHW17707.1 YggS family pyridoxal phosphate-dependent enzyme [Candidatus Fermentithermobacillaceae bacterium]
MNRENVEIVRARIEAACKRAGRDVNSVRLIAVSKKVPAETIREAMALGIKDFGENQVQEARAKIASGAFAGARVILVGHLQTNKASLAARLFDEVQSVDSLRVAAALSKFSVLYRNGKPLPVMIEVNIGKDPAKFGCPPEEALSLARAILELPGLFLSGLMTVAPGQGDPAVSRKAFRDLRLLRDEMISRGIPRENLQELSMGMSSDFEVAIEEGATVVRIGTALFGPRPK